MRLRRVGDILRLERRPVAVDPFETYEEIGVRSFGKGIFHKEPIPGTDLGSKRVFEIRPGDLVLSNVFAWEGAVALAGEAERGRIGSHRFMTYVAISDDVDVSYMRYFFLTDPGIVLLNRASPGSAGRNKTLAIDRFEAVEIPLPNVTEQRRVAARLDRIGVATDQCSKVAAHWGRLHTALVPALAQRPDLTEESKRKLHWERVRLRDVMTQTTDLEPARSEGSYPNVGILSFGRGLFEKAPIEGLRTSAKTLNRIRSGQFIYSRLFAFEGAYAEVPAAYDGYFVSNEFPTFDVDSRCALVGFITSYLKSPSIWAELASQSKGLGVRRQRVQPEKLLDFRIWLPPLEEQHRVTSSISKTRQSAEKRELASETLSALQSAAINHAFAGLL
jgi:hypothetical protein